MDMVRWKHIDKGKETICWICRESPEGPRSGQSTKGDVAQWRSELRLLDRAEQIASARLTISLPDFEGHHAFNSSSLLTAVSTSVSTYRI